MDSRRTWLQRTLRHASAAALGALPAFRAPAQAPAALPADICSAAPRSARPFRRVVARGSALVCEGTHILAQGALRELASAFGGETAVEVRGGGCDDGIAAVLENGADLGALCCPVQGTPAQAWTAFELAWDLKVAVVHPQVQAERLTMDQLQAVAAGHITNWRNLGGANRAIALVVRDHCPTYAEPVRRRLLGPAGAWSSKALQVERDEQLVDLVSRFESAIGLVSWVFARPLVEAGRLRALALDGALPVLRGRPNPRYGLHGPLLLATDRWDAARMAPFLDFVFSPAGRAIVERQLLPASPAGQRTRLQQAPVRA